MLRGDIARTQNRIDQLAATIARLEAEISGAATINAAQLELAKMAPETLKSVLAQEQSVLDMRIAEVRIREASDKQLKDIAVRNLEAAKEQLHSVDTRINLARQRLESANKLIAQGFTQGSQRLELEADIASMEGERSEYVADVATQEAALVNYDAGIEAFLQQRKTELLTALHTSQREREALLSTLSDSVKALQAYLEAAAGTANSVLTFAILRTNDSGETDEIAATELTPLQPGDLVRITKLPGTVDRTVAGN